MNLNGSPNFNELIDEYEKFKNVCQKYSENTEDNIIINDINRLLDSNDKGEATFCVDLLKTGCIPKRVLLLLIDNLITTGITGHYFLVWDIHIIIKNLYFKDEDYVVKLVDEVLFEYSKKWPEDTVVFFIASHLFYTIGFKKGLDRFLIKYKEELKDWLEEDDFKKFSLLD